MILLSRLSTILRGQQVGYHPHCSSSRSYIYGWGCAKRVFRRSFSQPFGGCSPTRVLHLKESLAGRPITRGDYGPHIPIPIPIALPSQPHAPVTYIHFLKSLLSRPIGIEDLCPGAIHIYRLSFAVLLLFPLLYQSLLD